MRTSSEARRIAIFGRQDIGMPGRVFQRRSGGIPFEVLDHIHRESFRTWRHW
jgi:hypothetical protein